MQIQTSQITEKRDRGDAFLTIDNVSKVYPTPKGAYNVIDNVSLAISEGEFVCIIGHSGCGKTTLLNMVAGFVKPTAGEVRLQNQCITKPGPDRMMVFQNYSLLPWKTAFENIYLAVKTAYPNKSRAERVAIVEEHLAMVGLTESAHKRPGQLSGGMKQRVAIARALAIRPQVLILDEPFGALDAITREELQEELLEIWREHRVTVLMITHDIDEALFLADKLVMMTNGPAAKIGEVLEIPFPRPRERSRTVNDPRYYELRNYALDFLFRRFAHSEEPTAVEEKNPSSAKAGALPVGILSLATASVVLAGGLFYALSHRGNVNVAKSISSSLVAVKSAPAIAPTPTAAASPATTPTPTAAASPATTPTPTVAASIPPTPSPEITDPAKLEELNDNLYAQIDETWQQTPTFTENLVYRVKVTQQGAIASYESVNQAASDYLQEIPLPSLVKSAPAASASLAEQPLAQFQVVFAPTGELTVTPASRR